MGRPTVGLLLYGNPDHYPPTVNAAHVLAERYRVVIVGRNQGQSDRSYPTSARVHRLGVQTSVAERERRSAGHKLLEFSRFVAEAAPLLADASLVYAYDTLGLAAALLAYASPGRRRPIVFHSHELEALAKPASLLGMGQALAWPRLSETAAAVFPDQGRAEGFEQLARIASTPIIVPNFPLRSLFPSPPIHDLIPSRLRRPSVLYRGSIGESSAMLESVSAVAQLPSKVRLEFVGFLRPDAEGVLGAHVASEGLQDRFSYAGVLPYAELQPLTERAAVGLAMYKGSSQALLSAATASNKIYEYAACGLPVIVSDFPGYRHALGTESWVRFADPEDPRSIAKALEDLLLDPAAYRKTCFEARLAFETRFNFEVAFEPLNRLFADLIAPA
jgi:glycosyltransferase involved in cell wall biosynthesis